MTNPINPNNNNLLKPVFAPSLENHAQKMLKNLKRKITEAFQNTSPQTPSPKKPVFASSLDAHAQEELKKLKDKTTEAFQNISPQTPPSKKTIVNDLSTPPSKKYTAIPPTPSKKEIWKKSLFQKDSRENLFQKPLHRFKDNQFSKIKNPTCFSLENAYKHKDYTYTIIQQISKKDCGAAAFLMLSTDLMRCNENGLKFNDSIWQWATSCDLINAETLLRQCNPLLTNSSYHLERKIFRLVGDYENSITVNSPDELICNIQQILETSGFSVILSITHPKIYGHWIVVDSIDQEKDEIFVRDPYSGEAYQLTFSELRQSIEPDVNTDCIFIEERAKE